MTQKDKDLLLKDICARLPYSVKASFYDVEKECETYDVIEGVEIDKLTPSVYIGQYSLDINEIKPYLFPLSSVSKEQIHQLLRNLKLGSYILNKDFDITLLSSRSFNLVNFESVFKFFDKNYIDYRGLIPKGLAIDATNKNIY